MKINSDGMKVLRNFSTINQSIIVSAGTTVSTMSPGRTVLARYVFDEPFPTEFAIYDLNQFMAVVSLFDDPSFDFEDKFVTISDSESNSRYYFADKKLIAAAPTSGMDLPSNSMSFTLTEPSLKAIMQAANVMKLPEILVVGDGKNLSVVAGNMKNDSASNFARPVGTTDKKFKLAFKLENLKMMLGTYDVQISPDGISKWVAKNINLTYYVAVEANSTFGA